LENEIEEKDDVDAYSNVLHFQSECDNPCSKWRRSGGSGVFDGAGVPQICGSLRNIKANNFSVGFSNTEMLRRVKCNTLF
jgi:hypothetical protein